MRAHELTAAILAPPLAPIGHGDRQLVRHNLTNAIPAMVENLPLGDQVVVTLAMLRQVARDPAFLSLTRRALCVEAGLRSPFTGPVRHGRMTSTTVSRVRPKRSGP